MPVATAVVDCLSDPSSAEFGAAASVPGADLEGGLTAAEAASRMARDDPNELRAVKQRSTWRRALSQLQDPRVGLLLVAAAVALLAWWVEALSIALVAGLLYPLTGWLQSPTIAALAMSPSSASAIGNALRLRGGRHRCSVSGYASARHGRPGGCAASRSGSAARRGSAFEAPHVSPDHR